MTRQSRSGPWSAIALPTSLLVLGAALRLSGLARDQRLHGDEAYYADLARRITAWGDWQLLGVPLDKPPLFFFLSGLWQVGLGDSEFALRLLNAFGSLLSLSLFYALARRLSGDRQVAGWAALLVALAPLEIALASSGFQDTWMMLGVLAALLSIGAGALGLGRSWFGMALAIKPTAIWMAPLVLGVGLLQPGRAPWPGAWRWGRGVVGILLLVNAVGMQADPPLRCGGKAD
ncbi:MAG: phospholipid carrier-dependent glycosyltransferase, partial [Anaerolineae bacterium]|nr:phospholipid carrier-dependent glycosyltransferase [Anaerolineae bacterium]